jgi:hypothetical protein
VVTYQTLFEELDISNVRELEDLIIETIYMVRSQDRTVVAPFPGRNGYPVWLGRGARRCGVIVALPGPDQRSAGPEGGGAAGQERDRAGREGGRRGGHDHAAHLLVRTHTLTHTQFNGEVAGYHHSQTMLVHHPHP